MNQPAEQPQVPTPPVPPAPAPAAQAAPQPALGDPRRKSPFLAGLLSAMPGLGQVYIGYYKRGFINVLTVASLIALLSFSDMGPFIPLAAIFLAFFWLYNIVDAVRRAALYNYALEGGAAIELPADFQPGLRGSILGGGALMALGANLLAHTRFDYSLEWLEEWWPLVFIFFGGYLVFKAIQEKSAGEPAE